MNKMTQILRYVVAVAIPIEQNDTNFAICRSARRCSRLKIQKVEITKKFNLHFRTSPGTRNGVMTKERKSNFYSASKKPLQEKKFLEIKNEK